jgi:3-deoxy-D-manno-octulosonic-acid transferase
MHLRLYRLVSRLAHRLPLGRGKLAQSIRGRRSAGERWLAWAGERRLDGPLVWVHAASVGEALAVQPVVERLRRARPDLQFVRSYSSPSADGWPAPFEADHADYVPLDEPAAVAAAFDAVQPTLMLFSRGDLWPELVLAAADRGTPVAVAGAIVRPRSARMSPLLNPLYAEVHTAVSWLGAVTSDDAARWQRLGVSQDRVSLTGDPRHDQVLERVPRLELLGALSEWSARGAVLVAGSTEPEDVPVLLGAAARVLAAREDARLLIVPHSPTDEAVSDLVRRAQRLDLTISEWRGASDAVPREARAVVVAASGLLFDLYALGAAAYVGGGFRRDRLHAVVEPAAFALPATFGPDWQTSSDAAAAIDAGGAAALPRREAQGALEKQWLAWLEDPDARLEAGIAARGTLDRGAASETARKLLRLLPAAIEPPSTERPSESLHLHHGEEASATAPPSERRPTRESKGYRSG